MLKLIKLSRCTLCTIAAPSPKTLPNDSEIIPKKFTMINKKLKLKDKISFYDEHQRITNIKKILEKYNIDSDEIGSSKFKKETSYTVEKYILLLQELGAQRITSSTLANLPKESQLPVKIFKAYFLIDSKVNLAENIFSFVDNSKLDFKDLSHLDENLSFRNYYYHCFTYFLNKELDMSDKQNERFRFNMKVFTRCRITSIRLLKEFLEFFKTELNFNPDQIITYRTLLGYHPEEAKKIIKILSERYSYDFALKLIARYPYIIQQSPKDLKTLISYLKSYKESSILSNCYILSLSPNEFQFRLNNLLENPVTFVYQCHPSFLALISGYRNVVPKLHYLQEQNFQYTSIYMLIAKAGYYKDNFNEKLTSFKKLYTKDLKCFFKFQFGNEAENLLSAIERHPYYKFVPLLRMFETVTYLREIHPEKVINKHIYAVLYDKSDIQAAYESLLNDPQYSDLPSHHFLPLCIYKIEENHNFSGEGVLPTEKSSESSDKSVNQESENRTENISLLNS